MNGYVSPLPPKDTAADTLLTLIAVTGELPAAQAARFAPSAFYLEKTVTALKKEKLIRTYYKDGLRGYRLTAKAKKLLQKERPDQFGRFFSAESVISNPKYTIQDRLRLHRLAESMTAMTLADFATYPWEKPTLFQNGNVSGGVVFSPPCYYTAGEIKEIGQEAAKFRGSRATGVLLSFDDDYAVYNTGNAEMEWKFQAEVRMKTFLARVLSDARRVRRIPKAAVKAIMLASDMSQLHNLMDTVKQSKHQFFVLDGSYEHFYYVTNDSGGEVILQLLGFCELRSLIDSLLSKDLAPNDPLAAYENDGFDRSGLPVLFAYTCDMPRIKRYVNALTERNMRGRLICFDFQAEALHQVCGENIKIQTLDLEAVKGGIANQ